MRRTGISLLAILTVATLASAVNAGVAATVNQGNHFYQAGEYDRAVEKYGSALQKQPESDIINFNIGSALYKSAQYEEAAQHFQKVLLSEDQGLKQKAHYNSGNALYRQGETVSSQNLQDAVPFLKQSIDQYEQALVIDPQDQDAQFNYNLAKQFLERIEKQIQEQQQQQQKQQKKDQQQSQDQQQQESEQQEGQKQDQASGSDQEESPKDQSADKQPQSDHGQKEDQTAEERSQNSLSSPEEERQETGGSAERKEQQSRELSVIKAKQLLDEYEQGQDAKQFLNLKGPFSERPVMKDW